MQNRKIIGNPQNSSHRCPRCGEMLKPAPQKSGITILNGSVPEGTNRLSIQELQCGFCPKMDVKNHFLLYNNQLHFWDLDKDHSLIERWVGAGTWTPVLQNR